VLTKDLFEGFFVDMIFHELFILGQGNNSFLFHIWKAEKRKFLWYSSFPLIFDNVLLIPSFLRMS